MIIQTVKEDDQIRKNAGVLRHSFEIDHRLIGGPLFLMAEYNSRDPDQVLPFYAKAAISMDWVVRLFAADTFCQVINNQRENLLPWLLVFARSPGACTRHIIIGREQHQ